MAGGVGISVVVAGGGGARHGHVKQSTFLLEFPAQVVVVVEVEMAEVHARLVGVVDEVVLNAPGVGVGVLRVFTSEDPMDNFRIERQAFVLRPALRLL